MYNVISILFLILILSIILPQILSKSEKQEFVHDNPIFGNVWKKDKLLAIKTLHTITACLDSHHIPYFIAYGTLLGYYRHRDFIPWDDDIDIIVIENPEKVRTIVQSVMNIVTIPLGIDKCFLPESSKIFSWGWPFVDIFYAKQINGELFVYNKWQQSIASTYFAKDVFPLRTVEFNSINVNIPLKPKTIIYQEYGPKSLKYCKSNEFDHRLEMRIPKCHTVKCKNIQTYKQFTTFVINLKRRPDRLMQVTTELNKLQIDKFIVTDAVDAKSINIINKYAQLPYNKISVEEFACGLSHINVWQQIVLEKIPLALIFEDDIVVPDNISQKDIWDRIADGAGGNLILLGYCGYKAPVFKQSGKLTCQPGTAVCLHAYIVTYNGAKQLLKQAANWDYSVPIDWLSERLCKNKLCFLSTDIDQSQSKANYFGHGIIFQNNDLGTNIGNKKKTYSYV